MVAVTGAAGFIGFHLVRRLHDRGAALGSLIDSLDPSYEPNLSRERRDILQGIAEIHVLDLNSIALGEFAERLDGVDALVHLAASPGVRWGEDNPLRSFQNNVAAFQNVLGLVEAAGIPNLLFASSSSVYGDLGVRGSCRERQANGSQGKSWYAQTKWINELQALDFSRRTGISVTALRFFTVYGSFGRPDMAYFKFASAIQSGSPLILYGQDGGSRDFTHVHDVADIVTDLLFKTSVVGVELPKAINIGAGTPRRTLDLVNALCRELGRDDIEIVRTARPLVDAEATYADPALLNHTLGPRDMVSLEAGIEEFAEWWKSR